MTSVALVGPDGVGKSTVTAALPAQLAPLPVTVIYMGVNLESSTQLLPTTRLLLAVKRARGGRPDLVATAHDRWTGADRSPPSLRTQLKDALRLTVWMSEEWYRQLLAYRSQRRGAVVVFDRHFFADYYRYDGAHSGGRRSLPERIHASLLQRVYPKPDVVVLLDAPAEVLFRRKAEATVAWLDRRRGEYRELAGVVRRFVIVDADRPVDEVTRDVAEVIRGCVEGGRT